MRSRTHKSYKLQNDDEKYFAELVQVANSSLYNREQQLKEAQLAYDECVAYNKDCEEKLIEVLTRKHKSVIINRVKYSVKDGKLVKEIILD